MVYVILLSLISLNSSLDIDLWVNKEDAIYCPTENLKIFFRTNEDCYIAIYNTEKGGRVNRLFPLEEEDGWIEADETYQLPPAKADYDYVIEGPEGVETIIAMASRKRLPKLDDKGPDIVDEIIEIYIREAEPAKLRIITSPKNCQIYITEVESGVERYVNKSPRTIVLRPGKYDVKIKKFGYKTLTRRIWIEPGERRKVRVKLNPDWY